MKMFKYSKKRTVPSMVSFALPSMILIFLFFFLATTNTRSLKLRSNPNTSQGMVMMRLARKTLATYIYVGPSIERDKYNKANSNSIQINDMYAQVSDIEQYIKDERATLNKTDQNNMIVFLKIDKHIKMGVVADIRQALRNSGIVKVRYATVD
jgi:biopolymer transport protein ExbD